MSQGRREEGERKEEEEEEREADQKKKGEKEGKARLGLLAGEGNVVADRTAEYWIRVLIVCVCR
jgi:hypothetical protein